MDRRDQARRISVTFYLPEELRNRARTAYRRTSFLESDRSWSEMIGKALLAEVERREAEHNDGRTFQPTETPLAPGRPIGFSAHDPQERDRTDETSARTRTGDAGRG